MAESIFIMLDKIGARSKNALELFMNDDEMLTKYIRNFPDEPTMGKLTMAVKNKDYDAAEKAVHALKGIARSLEFRSLADAAMDMLDELRDGNIEAALDAYADVEVEYNKFCSVINKWKSDE